MIESAMKDLHFSLNIKRNNKQQALQVIKQLQEVIKELYFNFRLVREITSSIS